MLTICLSLATFSQNATRLHSCMWYQFRGLCARIIRQNLKYYQPIHKLVVCKQHNDYDILLLFINIHLHNNGNNYGSCIHVSYFFCISTTTESSFNSVYFCMYRSKHLPFAGPLGWTPDWFSECLESLEPGWSEREFSFSEPASQHLQWVLEPGNRWQVQRVGHRCTCHYSHWS